MPHEERWLTFDCFGTIVSWQKGFPEILASVAGERSEELANAYHRFEAQIESGPYRTYRAVLHDALRLAADEIGLALSDGQCGVLAERWERQPVFPDSGPAMDAAKRAGWKIAALTNCDRDLFERTKATLPFTFDAVVTAQDVRSYKPAHGHFVRFAESGVSREHWIHVACSYFHDVRPAHELGIRCVWIDRDRTGEDPSLAAAVQPALDGLLETLERLTS